MKAIGTETAPTGRPYAGAFGNLPTTEDFGYQYRKRERQALVQRNDSDKWHWIALGAGTCATVLLLLLLYAQNGIWKAAAIVLIGVTLLVMLWNPKYRLFALGTTSALSGLGGFVTELSFNVSATLPGGAMFSGGIDGGTDVPPIYYLLLLVIGILTIAFDSVGRGWIWSFTRRNDPTRPDLTFTLEQAFIVLTDQLAPAGEGRFHASLLASKAEGNPLRLVRVEIEDAKILEIGVGQGDGVQSSLTIDKVGGMEISVLGTFPKDKLSKGAAKRNLVVVDEFNRRWSAGTVEFRLPT